MDATERAILESLDKIHTDIEANDGTPSKQVPQQRLPQEDSFRRYVELFLAALFPAAGVVGVYTGFKADILTLQFKVEALEENKKNMERRLETGDKMFDLLSEKLGVVKIDLDNTVQLNSSTHRNMSKKIRELEKKVK